MASYWQIFISFFKIGSFTLGGGYAMIPLIQQEVVDKKGWLKENEFVEMMAIAQSAPGPIALNTAIFVGYKARGIKGHSGRSFRSCTFRFLYLFEIRGGEKMNSLNLHLLRSNK